LGDYQTKQPAPRGDSVRMTRSRSTLKAILAHDYAVMPLNGAPTRTADPAVQTHVTCTTCYSDADERPACNRHVVTDRPGTSLRRTVVESCPQGLQRHASRAAEVFQACGATVQDHHQERPGRLTLGASNAPGTYYWPASVPCARYCTTPSSFRNFITAGTFIVDSGRGLPARGVLTQSIIILRPIERFVKKEGQYLLRIVAHFC
jgi:hypothetical protein